MEIHQKDNGKKGMFYIAQNGKTLAEMAYVWDDKNMVILSTNVSDALSGKGVGKQLLQKAVDFARAQNIKIMPLCPFAKAIFGKVEAYKDVLV